MNRRQILMAMAGAIPAAAGVRPVWASPYSAPLTLNGALALTPVIFGGGMPVSFLVDTGAEATAVDRFLAGSLGLDTGLAGSGLARGPSTGIKAAGRLVFVEPAIVDLRPVAAALDQAVMGLLGSDILSSFSCAIDFAGRTLTLNPSVSARPANGHTLRFSGMPFVRASIRHGAASLAGEFALDTGLDATVKLARDKAMQAFPGAPTSEGSIVSIKGRKAQTVAQLDAIQLAGLDVTPVAALIADDPPPRRAECAHCLHNPL